MLLDNGGLGWKNSWCPEVPNLSCIVPDDGDHSWCLEQALEGIGFYRELSLGELSD